METRYPVATVDEAFEMFDQGITLSAIGRALGISRRTVTRWREEFGWVERRERNRAAAGRELDKTCVDRRVVVGEKALEGLENVLDGLLMGIYPAHVDKIASAALNMAKTLNLLTGVPTEIQEQRIATLQDLWELARSGERSATGERDPGEPSPLLAVGSGLDSLAAAD